MLLLFEQYLTLFLLCTIILRAQVQYGDWGGRLYIISPCWWGNKFDFFRRASYFFCSALLLVPTTSRHMTHISGKAPPWILLTIILCEYCIIIIISTKFCLKNESIPSSRATTVRIIVVVHVYWVFSWRAPTAKRTRTPANSRVVGELTRQDKKSLGWVVGEEKRFF